MRMHNKLLDFDLREGRNPCTGDKEIDEDLHCIANPCVDHHQLGFCLSHQDEAELHHIHYVTELTFIHVYHYVR